MIATTNGRNPYHLVMDVTPDIAFRWLEGNTHNRPVNPLHVQRLAREMNAGRWRLTHQGIAFDVNGLLIDGQHRLWAVMEADMPVVMRVFFNEPAENRHVLDTGDRRSNLDILTITGHVGEVNATLLATLRAMLAGLTHHLTRRSPGDEAEMLTRHRSAVEFAVEHCRTAPAKGIATSHIRAVIARAHYSADHAQLAHFCDVLRTGLPAEENDRVILVLRDFLIQTHPSSHSEAGRRLRYAKTQWALVAFLDGRQPKRLCGSNEELFPLPDEAAQGNPAA
jgi:hypothetical protein